MNGLHLVSSPLSQYWIQPCMACSAQVFEQILLAFKILTTFSEWLKHPPSGLHILWNFLRYRKISFGSRDSKFISEVHVRPEKCPKTNIGQTGFKLQRELIKSEDEITECWWSYCQDGQIRTMSMIEINRMPDVSENNVLKEFREFIRAWMGVFADMHHGSVSI